MRSLVLYPLTHNTLQLSQCLVERTAETLEELAVHCKAGVSLAPNNDLEIFPLDTLDPRTLIDSANEPGLLTRTLFQHMLPFDKCHPFKALTALRLQNVNLRNSRITWCRVIDFRRIQDLRLYHCRGAESFLGQLTTAQSLPAQLRIFDLQHKDNADSEALIALEGLLYQMTGLRELCIDLAGVHGMPAIECLLRHAKTLRTLLVHARQDEGLNRGPEHVFSSENFAKLAEACPVLEQLSCAWPKINLMRGSEDTSRLFQDACAQMRQLVTLHISTWPSSHGGSGASSPRGSGAHNIAAEVTEPLLQALAVRIFRSVHGYTDFSIGAPPRFTWVAARLRLIAFGVRSTDSGTACKYMEYLRTTALDAHGHSVPHAAPVEPDERRYLEPRSDVLDFVLQGVSAPPERGTRGAGTELLSLPPLRPAGHHHGWLIPVEDDASDDG